MSERLELMLLLFSSLDGWKQSQPHNTEQRTGSELKDLKENSEMSDCMTGAQSCSLDENNVRAVSLRASRLFVARSNRLQNRFSCQSERKFKFKLYLAACFWSNFQKKEKKRKEKAAS